MIRRVDLTEPTPTAPVNDKTYMLSEGRSVRPTPETPDRLQVVRNVLASVVDIGAKTDYDALDPDVELKRACCHGFGLVLARRVTSRSRIRPNRQAR